MGQFPHSFGSPIENPKLTAALQQNFLAASTEKWVKAYVAAVGISDTNILNGTGAPSSGLGEEGDFYIDTAATAIYGPKASGSWGGSTSLIGPAGATGANGAAGATGATGATGASGADGDSAYEIAVADGFVGDEAAWLASLQGDPGLTWRGDWDSSTAYVVDDAVFHQGRSYVAVSGSTNDEPVPASSTWDLLAAGFRFRGTWDSATAYAPGDVVAVSGSSYVAIATSTNLPPSSHPGEWLMLAAKGADGAAGATGATGAAGTPGSVWYTNNGAPSASVPVDPPSFADMCLDTSTDDVYRWSGTAWVLQGNIGGTDGTNGTNGTNGLDGADGADIRTGTAAPDNGDGNDGDLYFNITNGDLYRKASGSWGLIANLVGPAGDDGANGADGDGFSFVRVAVEGNVNVASPGAGTYDGVSLATGDGVLLTAQSSQLENGPWQFNGGGTPMTRAVPGWGAAADVPAGSVVVVREGDTYANSLWVVRQNGGASLETITVDAEAQAWTRVAKDGAPGATGAPGDITSSVLNDLSDVSGSPSSGQALVWTGSGWGPAASVNSVLTTRGDIIRRGASAPERLALGAAGSVLGSDGTDAVWRTPAQRFKVGSFSVPGSTGNLTVSGVGFKPSLVQFAITWTTIAEVLEGKGAMDSSGGQWYTFGHINAANAKYSGSGNDACFALANAATTGVLIGASFVSMDTNGFTVNISTANSSGRVSWVAYA